MRPFHDDDAIKNSTPSSELTLRLLLTSFEPPTQMAGRSSGVEVFRRASWCYRSTSTASAPVAGVAAAIGGRRPLVRRRAFEADFRRHSSLNPAPRARSSDGLRHPRALRWIADCFHSRPNCCASRSALSHSLRPVPSSTRRGPRSRHPPPRRMVDVRPCPACQLRRAVHGTKIVI